mgnify:CR=1 FL=1
MTDYIIQILPSMIEGLGVSAEIFALTLVLSLPLGMLLALVIPGLFCQILCMILCVAVGYCLFCC